MIHLDADLPLFGDVPYRSQQFAVHKRDTDPDDQDPYLSQRRIPEYLLGRRADRSHSDRLHGVFTPAAEARSYFPIRVVCHHTCNPHNLNVRSIICP